MRLYALLVFLMVLNFITGCKEHYKPGGSVIIMPNQGDYKIDYKMDEYKLFIGQTFDSVNKIIDIQPDVCQFNLDDTNQIQYFTGCGETLIPIYAEDTEEVLPALSLIFNQCRLQEFSCGICHTHSESRKWREIFLKSLQPYFHKLNDKEMIEQLCNGQHLKFSTGNVEEEIFLDSLTGEHFGRFSYKIKYNKNL